MAVNVVKKEKVKGKIETLDKDGEVIDTEEVEVDEVIVDKPMANVGVKLGTTKNLGNYESLRVDVSLFYPCDPNKKDMDKAFKKAFKWVDKKLSGIMEDV
jgi:hypothetical protein